MIRINNLNITTNGDAQIKFLGFKEEDKSIVANVRIETKTENNFLSVTQFAKEAHISPQAVRKMISERRLDAEKLGEAYIIAKEELNRYLCKR